MVDFDNINDPSRLKIRLSFYERLLTSHLSEKYRWLLDRLGNPVKILSIHYNYVSWLLDNDSVLKIYDFENLKSEYIGEFRRRSIDRQIDALKRIRNSGLDINTHEILEHSSKEKVEWLLFNYVPGERPTQEDEDMIVEAIRSIRKVRDGDLVLSHNDLHYGNMIKNGSKIYFIDLELSSMSEEDCEINSYRTRNYEDGVRWLELSQS
ncbi:hypothetical protein BX667DRAFT_510574 [Coemansia mojavensis]|nr:hypothetical protein BX667DRAFT_510574 [Coemansia mojavensis]